MKAASSTSQSSNLKRVSQTGQVSIIRYQQLYKGIPIDAISSHSTKGNFEVEQNLIPLRWCNDGQQIVGSQFIYFKLAICRRAVSRWW
ncbi:hypothetical protein Ldro_2257 [Legionella drozanskii LLAP-1]|uniref:Uncharacterized protein n=1 Tax=Legionella drozanskii LLAP-1 TaxID=1212489 RepID=A0A0W0SRS1_9GAMM|nr:hypothetical protein Ldro_2257 [Legionella drozanskii LLAP-1]